MEDNSDEASENYLKHANEFSNTNLRSNDDDDDFLDNYCQNEELDFDLENSNKIQTSHYYKISNVRI